MFLRKSLGSDSPGLRKAVRLGAVSRLLGPIPARRCGPFLEEKARMEHLHRIHLSWNRLGAPLADMTFLYDNSRAIDKVFSLVRVQAKASVLYDCRDAAAVITGLDCGYNRGYDMPWNLVGMNPSGNGCWPREELISCKWPTASSTAVPCLRYRRHAAKRSVS